MNHGDRIFKLLNQCNKKSSTPDLHSFTAYIKNGTVFVECRGFEVYIESKTDESTSQWVGTTIAAANRLEALGIDLLSIEI